MRATPLHHQANPDLLKVVPAVAKLVEAGCSSGALAAAYKRRFAGVHYVGIEVEPSYARLAAEHCDTVLVADLDGLARLPPPAVLRAPCWVFGDCLEHLVDPWAVLRWVHQLLPPAGVVCACIPNAQHWTLQSMLSIGALHYQQSGLLDRMHLRWFTRTTMVALFEDCGYRVRYLKPRLFPHPDQERVLPQIQALAVAAGGDPEQARADALPLQYVLVAERLGSS